MGPTRNKPRNVHTIASLARPVFASMTIIVLCAGCATSSDMEYNYRANAALCSELTKELAKRGHDSAYRRKLNQRYSQDCVGK